MAIRTGGAASPAAAATAAATTAAAGAADAGVGTTERRATTARATAAAMPPPPLLLLLTFAAYAAAEPAVALPPTDPILAGNSVSHAPLAIGRIPLQRTAHGWAGEHGKKTLLDGFASAQAVADVSDLVERMAGDTGAMPLESAVPSAEVAARSSIPNRTEEVRSLMTDVADLFYTVNVKLGTPPVTARLLVDTGSADMWVRNTVYQPGASFTSNSMKRTPVLLIYGRGFVLGHELKETVCFEGLCLANETLVAAVSVQGIGNEMWIDGLLGFGFSVVKKTVGKTLLASMMNRHSFKHLAFGLQLHSTGESFFVIGEYEKVAAEAPSGTDGLAIPVPRGFAGPIFWMLPTKISASSWHISAMTILDSGTSLLSVPIMYYRQVIKGLFTVEQLRQCAIVRGFVICPCALRLTPITFTFTAPDHRELSISLGSDDLLSFLGVAFLAGKYDRVCRLGVMPSPGIVNQWLLGDAFFRRVYIVHDVALNRLVLFPQRPADALHLGHQQPSSLPSPPASSAHGSAEASGGGLAGDAAAALAMPTQKGEALAFAGGGWGLAAMASVLLLLAAALLAVLRRRVTCSGSGDAGREGGTTETSETCYARL